MVSILLSSNPSSPLLHFLRPNPNPRLSISTSVPPLSISIPLNPASSTAVSLSLRSSVNHLRHSVTVSARLMPSLLPPPPPPEPSSPSPFLSTIIRLAAAALSFLRSLIQSISAAARRFLQKFPPGSLQMAKRVLVRGMLIYELMLLMRHAFRTLLWHRQPLMAVAQLCDPFLALSRHVIPPLFGSSDLSEHLGIQVLSTLDLVLMYAWRR